MINKFNFCDYASTDGQTDGREIKLIIDAQLSIYNFVKQRMILLPKYKFVPPLVSLELLGKKSLSGVVWAKYYLQ